MIRRSEIQEIVGIAALDLFASSLGVFILLYFVLIPYFQRAPGEETQRAAVEAEIARLEEVVHKAQTQTRIAAQAHEAARQAQAQAQAEARAAHQAQLEAQAKAQAPPPPPPRPAPKAPRSGFYFPKLDLVFVIDTTNSMRSEIKEMRDSMVTMARIVGKLSEDARVGIVAYRDRDEAYLTRVQPLVSVTQIRALQGFVDQLTAAGGGDEQEDVLEALRAAAGLAWRPDAEQLIVVIADAAGHRSDWEGVFRGARQFRRKEPPRRRISAIVTARHPENRRFFSRLTEAGAGEYVPHAGRLIDSVLLSILEHR